MKKLLPIVFSFFLFTCLVACGGDEPVPTLPPGAEDTTEVDTVLPDTIPTDTTEVDTTEVEPFVWKAGILEQPYIYFTSTRGKGLRTRSLDLFGNDLDYRPEPNEPYQYVVSARGCDSIQFYVQIPFTRNISLELPLHSQAGIGKWDPNESSEGIKLCNDERNRQETQVEAEVSFPPHCYIGNMMYSGDSLLVCAYQPPACMLGNLQKGGTLSGAVAGITLAPVVASFDKEVDISVMLPVDVSAYALELMSGSQEEGSVENVAGTIRFTTNHGGFFTLLMNATIVSLRKESIEIMSHVSSHSRPADAKGKVHAVFIDNRIYYGYEADGDMGFMESRFLNSLFGKYGISEDGNCHCTANRPFTMEYNVTQAVYHLTFEAAGRSFSARVYGETELEVINIIPDE